MMAVKTVEKLHTEPITSHSTAVLWPQINMLENWRQIIKMTYNYL